MEETKQPRVYSIDELSVQKSCEKGFEFEVKDEKGKGTGIFMTVMGGHAVAIEEFTTKALNERRIAEAMAVKSDPRGKKLKVVPVEDDIEFADALVAMRVMSWRGIKEACTLENVLRVCKTNPPIKEQILEASEELKNFPSPFTAKSASASDTSPT